MALFIVWTHDQIGVLLNPIVKNGPANPKSIPNNLIKKTTHSPSLLKSGIKRTDNSDRFSFQSYPPFLCYYNIISIVFECKIYHLHNTREIGNTTYDSIDFANPQIESNASANGRYNYYGEIQETGRYGMWNYYLFGTLPYGFDDDSAINLLMLTAFDDSPNQNQVEILRKTAKPNTFAIIASDYYDHISLLPISDEWENIYHLLIRAQSD